MVFMTALTSTLQHFPAVNEFLIWVLDPHFLIPDPSRSGQPGLFVYHMVQRDSLGDLLNQVFGDAAVRAFCNEGPLIQVDDFKFGSKALLLVDSDEIKLTLVDGGFYVLTKESEVKEVSEVKIVCLKSSSSGKTKIEFGVGDLLEIEQADLGRGVWAGYKVAGRVKAVVSSLLPMG